MFKLPSILIERLMSLGSGELRERLPPIPPSPGALSHDGTWKILRQATLSFDSRTISDVFLRPDLDRLNFQKLTAGTELGNPRVS